VSTLAELTPTRPFPPRRGVKGSFVYRVVTTTDPKLLGIMYTVTSVAFFMAGGLMALLMRSELAVPGLQFLSNEQYNQLFTMHGTIMLPLYATPIVFGFANCILPLQIGAPDVAFPRLNALSYWLYPFGALVTVAGFLTLAVQRTSAGRRIRPLATPCIRPVPAPICGSWVWPSPVWARSWVRST
jgi:cytochrome c oxidase subunit I